jgi:hypothetical protein
VDESSCDWYACSQYEMKTIAEGVERYGICMWKRKRSFLGVLRRNNRNARRIQWFPKEKLPTSNFQLYTVLKQTNQEQVARRIHHGSSVSINIWLHSNTRGTTRCCMYFGCKRFYHRLVLGASTTTRNLPVATVKAFLRVGSRRTNSTARKLARLPYSGSITVHSARHLRQQIKN